MDNKIVYRVLEEIKGDVKELRKEQVAIKTELTKYKGFIGGIAFMVATISTALSAALTFLKGGFHS